MVLEAAETGVRLSKEDFKSLVPAVRVDLINAQFDLRRADFSAIVVLAGDDRIGCEQVFDRLHEWMDARYLDGEVFPLDRTEEEKLRPPLWRYWQAQPRVGRIGLFLGGWTTEAIFRCLRQQPRPERLERILESLRCFERTLVENGTLLLKFWLHLPREASRKRLERGGDGRNGWRPDRRDRWLYRRYGKLVAAAETVLKATHRDVTPWHVVESTDPEHRDLAVGSTLRDALRQRLMRPPAPAAAPPPPRERESPPALAGIDLGHRLDPDTAEERLRQLQAVLHRKSDRARRRGVTSVFVFEGWDAAGKGGTIRRMTSAMAARNYRVIPVAAPTEEERAHHYLWRFWRRIPRAGQMVIFDRSWYGRVLVERVEGFAREEEWRRAYEEINAFEAELLEHGILLLKFWLHIDREEQMRRLEARLNTPYKKYKVTADDFRNRGKWDAYAAAANDMVARTSTPDAPWHLIAANDKPTARVEVLDIVCHELQRRVRRRA